MADKFYRATVTIPMDSGLPADSVVNTWAFRHLDDALLLTDTTAIDSRLSAFYSAIGAHFSSQCDLSAVRLKIYDYTDPFPRVPVYDEVMTVTGAHGANMDFPPEVAVCLSFRAAIASGTNMARNRGRVYLGPLQSTSTTDYQAVLTTTVDAIALAAKTEILDENDDTEWCIYSYYTHHNIPVGSKPGDGNGPGLDGSYPESEILLADSFQLVSALWVDNAWDTQRRRGTKATYRKTY